MIIMAVILLLISIIALIIKLCVDGKDKDFGMVISSALAILFAGILIGQYTNTNTTITTQNITTYTYQCQICEETTTQTKEPQIMICDDCKEIIKNIESEIKENENSNE